MSNTLEMVIDERIMCEVATMLWDGNPLHHSEEYAQAMGFERRVCPALYLMALAEQMVRRVNEPEGLIGGIVGKFSRAIYGRERIRLERSSSGLMIIKDNEKKPAASFELTGLTQVPEYQGKSREFELDAARIESFNKLIGEPSDGDGQVYFSFPLGAVIATVLDQESGIFVRKFRFNFLKTPQPGKIIASVSYDRMVNEKRGLASYKIRGKCEQDGEPLIAGIARGTGKIVRD